MAANGNSQIDLYKVRVGFSRSPYIGAMIRFFTGGDVNHAFLIHFDPVYNTTVVLGADGNGFVPQKLSSFRSTIIRVYRPTDLNLLKGLRWAVAEGMLDEDYDYGGLLGMSAVEAAMHLTKRYIKNPLQSPHRVFCSEAVAQIIRHSGFMVLPQLEAGSVDPSVLDQALKQSCHFELDPEWDCNKPFTH